MRCVETVAFVAVRENASMFEAILHLKWKETPFFCCLMPRKPHASDPVCAAWMGFVNDPSWFSVCGPPWSCGTFVWFCLLYIICLASVIVAVCVFDRGKIPRNHSGVEIEQPESELISIRRKVPFQPVFHFLNKMINYTQKCFIFHFNQQHLEIRNTCTWLAKLVCESCELTWP